MSDILKAEGLLPMILIYFVISVFQGQLKDTQSKLKQLKLKASTVTPFDISQ